MMHYHCNQVQSCGWYWLCLSSRTARSGQLAHMMASMRITITNTLVLITGGLIITCQHTKHSYTGHPTNKTHPYIGHPTTKTNPYIGHPTNKTHPYIGHPTNKILPYTGHPTNEIHPYIGHPTNEIHPYIGYPTNKIHPYTGNHTNKTHPYTKHTLTLVIWQSKHTFTLVIPQTKHTIVSLIQQIKHSITSVIQQTKCTLTAVIQQTQYKLQTFLFSRQIFAQNKWFYIFNQTNPSVHYKLNKLLQGSYRKIRSKFTLFTNLCNMGQKSNTKVCNSAAHLVKGHNPYCSQRLMHFISQNWLEVHSLRFCTAIFLEIFLKRLFSLGKCSFWPISW